MATIISGFTTPLISREEIAQETMAFHFAKPVGFEFRAGQAIDMTLLNPTETDEEGNTRAFSLASAPFDGDLMLATRLRDTAFKRTLRTAALGLQVKIEGPSGSFVLHRKTDKPAVFMAGGIGITPFLSIIRQATPDRVPHQMFLFYLNQRPEDAPFLELLSETTTQNPNFHFIPTMTDMSKSQREWTGDTGFINNEMLFRYLPSLQGPIYYLAGPPAMVATMRRVLTGAGVDADDIRTEEFSGY